MVSAVRHARASERCGAQFGPRTVGGWSTGAGVKEIMYRIGHSSPQAALRYQHASLRRDRSIADGISKLITRERARDPESLGHD